MKSKTKTIVKEKSSEKVARFLEKNTLHKKDFAEMIGVTLSYVNRITKGREQIVNKTFVKMMDELGYDVELTYKRKTEEKIAR